MMMSIRKVYEITRKVLVIIAKILFESTQEAIKPRPKIKIIKSMIRWMWTIRLIIEYTVDPYFFELDSSSSNSTVKKCHSEHTDYIDSTNNWYLIETSFYIVFAVVVFTGFMFESLYPSSIHPLFGNDLLIT